MTGVSRLAVVIAVALSMAASGSLVASSVTTFPTGIDVDQTLLASVVGGCEEGSQLLADDNACEKDAQVCTVTTTDFTLGVSVGISVSYNLEVPTGCDQNDIDKPLCPGVVKYKVQGSGTTEKVEDKACDVKTKNLCQEVVRGTPFCVNVGTGGTVQSVIDAVVGAIDGIGGTNVTYDSSTGELCIDSDLLKKCQKHTPSDYSCGAAYPAEVEQCTE